MPALAPLTLIVIALTTGCWLIIRPIHVINVLTSLTIWIIKYVYPDKLNLLHDLQNTRQLLDHNRAELKSFVQRTRICGLVTLLTGVLWSWVFYG